MDGRTDDQRLIQQDAALNELFKALDADSARHAAMTQEQKDAAERERVLQNEVYRLGDELRRATEALATGKNMEQYLDWIGRDWASGTYECALEKHWPYGPERAYESWMIEVPDLGDAATWKDAPARWFTRTRDELIEAIHAELARALYYLTVICPRHHGHPFGDQHKEVVRMYEFVGLGGDVYSARRAKVELEHLDDQSLRAVLLIVEMSFENLC